MSFIAMNRFKIKLGHEDTFENIWRSRESHLKKMQGFQEFRLLKGPEAEDHRLYSSHVIWDSKEDFEAWTKSDSFRESHKNAAQRARGNGEGKPAGPHGGGESPFLERPQFEGFETVLHES